MSDDTTIDLEQVTLPADDPRKRWLDSYTSLDGLGNLTKAAAAYGISRKGVQGILDQDPLFRAIKAAADDEIRDAVRSEVLRRAIEGHERPIYQRGEIVGHVTEYDTRHLEWLAERLLPDEYHLATRVELVSGNTDGAVVFQLNSGEDIEDAEIVPLDDEDDEQQV